MHAFIMRKNIMNTYYLNTFQHLILDLCRYNNIHYFLSYKQNYEVMVDDLEALLVFITCLSMTLFEFICSRFFSNKLHNF